MSLWFCPNHRLTAAGSKVPNICDACGSEMSLALMRTSSGETEIYTNKEFNEALRQARIEALEEAAKVANKYAGITVGSDGSDDVPHSGAQFALTIAKEIRALKWKEIDKKP